MKQIKHFSEGGSLTLNFGKRARTYHYLTLQGKQIEAKESVRDTGIILESNGKFKKHINSVCLCVFILCLLLFTNRRGRAKLIL